MFSGSAVPRLPVWHRHEHGVLAGARTVLIFTLGDSQIWVFTLRSLGCGSFLFFLAALRPGERSSVSLGTPDGPSARQRWVRSAFLQVETRVKSARQRSQATRWLNLSVQLL